MALTFNMKRRIPYSDEVRNFAPIAQQATFAKRNRDLEKQRIDAERDAAQSALDQQNQHFTDSLEEEKRRHGESLAESSRQYEESMAERDRQHGSSLAQSASQFAEESKMRQDEADQAESQSNVATGVSLAGLGVAAYPHVASALGIGAGGTAAAGGATAATAAGGAAAGGAAAAGSGAVAGGGAAAGGAGAAAGGGASASGAATGAGLGSIAGPAAAITVPLAIAYGSGTFKQFGHERTPDPRNLWKDSTPEARNQLFGSMNGQQKAMVFNRYGNQMTKEQKIDAFISQADRGDRGLGYSRGKKFDAFLSTLSDAERSDAISKFNSKIDVKRQDAFARQIDPAMNG